MNATGWCSPFLPPDNGRLFQVIRYSGQSDAQLLSLAGYLGLLKLKNELPDSAQRLKGGKQRWA